MESNPIERRSGRRINKPLLWGLILLLPSLYTIFLMAHEEWLGNAIYSGYSVKDCFDVAVGQPPVSETPLRYVWHGQKVILSDDYEKGKYKDDDRRAGRVKIKINGKDYTSPWLVQIRPSEHDSNRYWLQVMLVKFDDKIRHTEQLVVLQSFPNWEIHEYSADNPDTLRCRALFIDANGRVTEDVFPFSERTSPLYRTLLVNEVSPGQLGFYSQALMAWPSVFYPFLYPLVTAIVGMGLTVNGFPKYRHGLNPYDETLS